MPLTPSRRDFLKSVSTGGVAALALGLGSTGAAAALPPPRRGKSVMGLRVPKLDVVRCGVIGLGARGLPTLRELMLLEGCEVKAISDIHAPSLQAGSAEVLKRGRAGVKTFGENAESYLKMLEMPDLDAVFICTPWRDHVPMAVAAMRAGKHAFIEVPAAVTLEECWQLVDTAEETQRHCMMMENVCYGRDELMLLRMCREGVFGELLHGEGAYIHDLRDQMKHLDHGTGSWRTTEHELRNGNIYPTHGLGPVAQYMSINRGDRFSRLVSFSSPSLGMPEYAERNFPAGHPRRTAKYICGDMNTSIIKTVRGRTIVVQHDTMNPNPYSRANVIKGTKGVFSGYPNRIYVEGRSPQDHTWETDLTRWYQQYDHPLWKKVEGIAADLPPEGTRGHGGMDFVMRWRIIQCLREGLPLDQDVYDAAAWSAISAVSEKSVAENGASLEIPDFTRGAWENTAPLGVVS